MPCDNKTKFIAELELWLNNESKLLAGEGHSQERLKEASLRVNFLEKVIKGVSSKDDTESSAALGLFINAGAIEMIMRKRTEERAASATHP
jgi:hypothetical protein